MITIEELNTLLPTLYLSDELEEIKWVELSDTDKQVLINKAVDEINKQQFDGKKVSEAQENAFPRIICREVIEIPQDVKKAICVLVYEFKNNRTNQRKRLQMEGVESISTAGVSEKYTIDKDKREISNKYKKYLSGWIYRGV